MLIIVNVVPGRRCRLHCLADVVVVKCTRLILFASCVFMSVVRDAVMLLYVLVSATHVVMPVVFRVPDV